MIFLKPISLAIFAICLSVATSNPASTVANGNFTTQIQPINASQDLPPSTRYNPFHRFHMESHKIYIVGTLFVLLFVFVKYASEKQFNYCRLIPNRDCHSDAEDADKRCRKHRTTAGNILPESAFLVTAGIIPAVLLLKLGVDLEGSLNPNFIFNVLLVPIVMGSAWRTDKIVFYRNLGTILLFAVIGTIVNTVMLAPLFYYGSKSRWGIFDTIDMDLIDSGLYATLICAVDPVAVLSVFESMHIDKLVYNVVFGESLLNDGVAMVFYRAFNEMKTIPDVQFGQSMHAVVLYFVYAFTVSVMLAVVMAVVTSVASKIFYKQQPMEFVVVFALNYLTYVISDSIKGSGIISLFFCVLLQRQYVQANLSATSNTIISQVLRQLSLLSEGVIFIMMGLTSFAPTGILKNTDIRFSLFLIVACYLSRFFVVYLLGTIVNVFRKDKLEYKKALFIQAHGGLRGAIGFSLVLTLDEAFTNRYFYQSATAIMVFFSVYVLGVSIKPLVNFLKITIENNDEKSVFLSLQDKICDRTKEGMKAIIASSSLRFKWEICYRNINNKYFKKWFMNPGTLERNISHSALLKAYRHQSNVESQDMANLESRLSLNEDKNSKCNSRSKLFQVAHKSDTSFQSLLNPNNDNGDQHLVVSNESIRQPYRFFLNGEGKTNSS